MAGYTFHNYTVDQTIDIMQQVNVHSLSIKDFHLPLDSSPEKIAEVLGKFRSAGIAVYAAGVIYMKTPAEADLAFDYARRIGVDMIIGSPSYRLDHGTRTEVVVRALGHEAAIVRHRWQGAGSFEGTPFTDDNRCVLVWEKQAGEWRIVLDQCSFSSK